MMVLQRAAYERGKHVQWCRPKMLGIQPERLRVDGIGLAEIHNSVAPIDSFETECLGQFFETHLLTIVFRRPTKKAQKVDVSEGEESVVTISRHTHHRPVFTLRKLGSIGRNQKRQVGKTRQVISGGLEDQDVFERVREVVLPSDYVRDVQLDIVRA